ncbi:hypothetical protein [Ectothiorhodospira lacustris]|uniref:hypothetical protein n=1 Tax=Ectothiorhodospira lacustris TaxID=2899127 RepID=UPI001EE963F9|nr:hypothetical protein [Ectothiorhodospira lacustris]MCG5500810.1 hypothetical protein [Ectothiorhodospira lacustris]
MIHSIGQLWRAWAALTLVLLVMLTLLLPAGDPISPRRSAPDGLLELPVVWSPVDPAEARAELAVTTLWGPRPTTGASIQAEPTSTAPAWFLSGVFMVQQQRHAVVAFEETAEEPLQLAVGEALPDGSVIVVIERDKLLIRRPDDQDLDWLHVNTPVIP